jgi:hypothetical protein
VDLFHGGLMVAPSLNNRCSGNVVNRIVRFNALMV